MMQKKKSFYQECVRVFKITKKPTKLEFKRIFAISGLGVLLIGLIGFAVTLVYSLFF